MEAVGFKQEAARVSVRTYADDSARIVGESCLDLP
jgi:hypothetical protein